MESFDDIINFRDVGKTVNSFLGKKLVKEGVLFRSARPDDATPADRKKLKEELGMRTVIDLRTKTEHLNAAKKRSAAALTPAVLQANAALAAPVQIPGLAYHEIRLTGQPFEQFLIAQLSWPAYLRLAALFATGFRMRAIRVMGTEVMRPRGLVQLGLDTLDASGAEMCAALRALAAPGARPVMVHCTQGKDRTGLVVSLVLLVLGAGVDAVQHDYMLSGPALVPEREGRLVEIREIGLPDEFIDVDSTMIQRTVEYLQERYGGVDGYLDTIGFTAGDRATLREALLYQAIG